jgi:[acyl-carrier-protein] S-malonyltransferase
MKALVFPGQGSQYKGMAKDIVDAFDDAKTLISQADTILGYKLSEIMFSGDEEVLKQTKHTQPAIFLHSVLASKFVEKSDVDITAGHSLGEYTAVYYAGAMSFEDALRVVQRRGELMQKAGEDTPGTMAAIIGLSDHKIEEVLAEANTFGVIQAANFNSPGQVVLSGELEAIRKSLEIAKRHGAKIAKELTVSGAFHSPLMKSAEKDLAAMLNQIQVRTAEIPICMNVTAAPTKNAEHIRENLILQLTSPVLWTQSIQGMTNGGVKEFVEVGPQKVLQGLIKRITPAAILSGIDTLADVQKLQPESV